MRKIENNPIEKYKMKLTTLSPVFIGGGESIKNLKSEEEFRKQVLNTPQRQEQWIDYFINFYEYKKNRDRRIPKDAKKPSLSGFLRFINDKNFERNKKSNQFIEEAGKHYIPGSSIKGAIRTAVVAELINKGKNYNQAEELAKELFKHIQVSDTNFIPQEKFCNKKIEYQQIIEEYEYFAIDRNPKELLKEGLILRFSITIDTSKCPISINQLLEMLSNFYQTVFEEHSIFEEISDGYQRCITVKDTPANINIGGQSGFNTKVVLNAMNGNNFAAYTKAKKEILSKNFSKHKHYSKPIAPRCLKMVERDNGNVINLGWCNISVEERLC